MVAQCVSAGKFRGSSDQPWQGRKSRRSYLASFGIPLGVGDCPRFRVGASLIIDAARSYAPPGLGGRFFGVPALTRWATFFRPAGRDPRVSLTPAPKSV